MEILAHKESICGGPSTDGINMWRSLQHEETICGGSPTRGIRPFPHRDSTSGRPLHTKYHYGGPLHIWNHYVEVPLHMESICGGPYA
eukprot:5124304-Pyramimonas_sp.AAC.1